jgi:hypothetical protein
MDDTENHPSATVMASARKRSWREFTRLHIWSELEPVCLLDGDGTDPFDDLGAFVTFQEPTCDNEHSSADLEIDDADLGSLMDVSAHTCFTISPARKMAENYAQRDASMHALGYQFAAHESNASRKLHLSAMAVQPHGLRTSDASLAAAFQPQSTCPAVSDFMHMDEWASQSRMEASAQLGQEEANLHCLWPPTFSPQGPLCSNAAALPLEFPFCPASNQDPSAVTAWQPSDLMDGSLMRRAARSTTQRTLSDTSDMCSAVAGPAAADGAYVGMSGTTSSHWDYLLGEHYQDTLVTIDNDLKPLPVPAPAPTLCRGELPGTHNGSSLPWLAPELEAPRPEQRAPARNGDFEGLAIKAEWPPMRVIGRRFPPPDTAAPHLAHAHGYSSKRNRLIQRKYLQRKRVRAPSPLRGRPRKRPLLCLLTSSHHCGIVFDMAS